MNAAPTVMMAEFNSPSASSATAQECDLGTIVDVAVGNGSFNTLVAAVTAADLAGTLPGDGPFTVFGKWHMIDGCHSII